MFCENLDGSDRLSRFQEKLIIELRNIYFQSKQSNFDQSFYQLLNKSRFFSKITRNSFSSFVKALVKDQPPSPVKLEVTKVLLLEPNSAWDPQSQVAFNDVILDQIIALPTNNL